MRLLSVVALLVSAPLLAGCQSESAANPPGIPVVQVQSVTLTNHASTLALTGDIQARNAGDLAFRVGGRVLERYVDVGDHVVAGQKLAIVDSAQQRAMQASAAAALAAAQAQLELASSTHERQQALFDQGIATRRVVDESLEAFRMAQGNVDAASAQLHAADEGLEQTVLLATAPGVITGRYVEAGEVVQPAQPVFAFAQDGDRDAVFDVYEAALLAAPEALEVRVRLSSNGQQSFGGTVREVAPSVDAQTGTIRIRVTIHAPPADLPLGATVIGSATIAPQPVVVLPAGALTMDRGRAAMWVVDAQTGLLALRAVTIAGFETDLVTVSDGLSTGDLVVVAGPRSMRAGQIVGIDGEAAK